MSETPDRTSTPVLKAAMQRLRRLALAAHEGDFLGSEQELQQLTGVSRPTFRQAVRILEQDHLLVKRMGPHGGYYAGRPDPRAAARAAALYLQLESATILDLLEVSHVLHKDMLSRACDCTDADARADLRDFLTSFQEAGEPADYTQFVQYESRFEQLVLAMAGNPVLRLFFQIARKFIDESTATQALISNPAVRRMRRIAVLRLGEAILTGDREQCLELSRQQRQAFLALAPDDALKAGAVLAGVAGADG